MATEFRNSISRKNSLGSFPYFGKQQNFTLLNFKETTLGKSILLLLLLLMVDEKKVVFLESIP